jgi:hypothetical protein
MVGRLSSVLLEEETRRRGDKGKGFFSSSPSLPSTFQIRKHCSANETQDLEGGSFLSYAVRVVIKVDTVYG